MHTYAYEIHGALSCTCVQERCVKWANLYLSDIEYSYRGAHSADKSVYRVLRTYGSSDCAIRNTDNGVLSMHLGRADRKSRGTVRERSIGVRQGILD